MELGRWGLNFYRLEDCRELVTASLANALRVILAPPKGAETIVLQIHNEGHSNWLRIGGGESSAGRGEAERADLVLSGYRPRRDQGDRPRRRSRGAGRDRGRPELLSVLRGWVELPERLRREVDQAAEHRLAI